jgi:low affinity Fe/Cu permease
MAEGEKGPLERIGVLISDWVADAFGHPYAQLGFILLCGAWWALGLNVNILTAVLSVLAITLTQMVLNSQKEREADAHRRDVAMHAKLDELIVAKRNARNELAGIEDLPEEEIEVVKEGIKDAIDQAAEPELSAEDRAAAKRVVEQARDIRRDK